MFYVGLDLGQRRDYSALVVVERQEAFREYAGSRVEALYVRQVERIPLGTSYPALVAGVRERVRHPLLAGRCSLVVDATGVGAPVVEMLRAAQLGCEVQAVTITGGAREQPHPMGGGASWSVPKADLMAGVQVALEKGELRIAREMGDVGNLVRELLEVRARPTDAGGLRMGADGYGQHDDLVIALALACWSARRRRVGFGNQRLF